MKSKFAIKFHQHKYIQIKMVAWLESEEDSRYSLIEREMIYGMLATKYLVFQMK